MVIHDNGISAFMCMLYWLRVCFIVGTISIISNTINLSHTVEDYQYTHVKVISLDHT